MVLGGYAPHRHPRLLGTEPQLEYEETSARAMICSPASLLFCTIAALMDAEEAGMPEAMVQLNQDTMGFEARPDSSEKLPGVLIMHEIHGINQYIKEVAQKLAENGYLAVAVDLYGGKVAQGMEDGAPLREAVTDEIF